MLTQRSKCRFGTQLASRLLDPSSKPFLGTPAPFSSFIISQSKIKVMQCQNLESVGLMEKIGAGKCAFEGFIRACRHPPRYGIKVFCFK
jgi:hypothetical protein